MKKCTNLSGVDSSRRSFLKLSAMGAGALAIGTGFPKSSNTTFGLSRSIPSQDNAIRSFNIDFNWGEGGPNKFARPGQYAYANPAEHIKWYKELGCNVVQTFAVSCNGYAWYKNGIVPEQPGLIHDFLPEMVKLGHRENMKVFGYFCIGANARWGLEHPDLSYGIPVIPHIPFTAAYLDYLGSAIEDAVKKTGMDGFMIDWLWNPGATMEPYPPLKWIACEQVMFRELMNREFPGKNKITPKLERAFRRKAIDRCWRRIHDSAKTANPDCIIWLTCCQVTSKDIAGSEMFKEVDWLMNEAGDLKSINAIRDMVGPQTRLITCLADWNQQDAKDLAPSAIAADIGLFGYTQPTMGAMLPPVEMYLTQPVDHYRKDSRNIATLARAYNGLPPDYVLAR